jgi:hypothetical protein
MPDSVITPAATGGLGGDILSIIDMIRGFQGRYTNQGNTAAGMADPFASQRPQYQKELLGLLTDPSTFTMDPGTKYAMDQGLSGVARFGNSMFGTTRSGNTADTLNRDAVGYASGAYNKRIDQLLTLSGATTGSPVGAAEAYLKGNALNDKAISNGAVGINAILDMLSKSGIGGAALDAIKKGIGMGGGGEFDYSTWNGNDYVNSDGSIDLGDIHGSGDQGGWTGDFGDMGGGLDGFDWSSLGDLPY